MRWYPDKTGRFRQRPHYEPDELERICEDEVNEFLRKQHGSITFPVSTSDLTIMIEQMVDDLDSGCDDLEDDVEGLTDFFPKRKPQVKIARRLQEAYLENRLRTTLTHEYGHVRLHGFLFQLDDELAHLFDGTPQQVRNRCHRDTIENGGTDWMEWQAGYACGALLMPQTPLLQLVRKFRENNNIQFSDIAVTSERGQALITSVVDAFQVSRDAARVRLERRNILVREARPGLFS
jgi:hypothetical protein